MNIRDDPSGEWLEHPSAIQWIVDASRPGCEAVLALSEVLFVETLRRYIDNLPPNKPGGWPIRDTEVGKALACFIVSLHILGRLLHSRKRSALLRTVLAERFRRYISETPIAYLTHWRLRLGAQMLTSTSSGVAHIGAEVGYESEASFNRAFKRVRSSASSISVLDQEQSEEKASVVPWPRSVRCGAKDSLKLRLKEREQATCFLSA